MTAAERSRPRILITGGSGQVGGALRHTLAPLGDIFAPGRGELDLTDPNSIRKAMREFQPRWVMNAAAHTAVDKAESEPELAFAINAVAPGIIADEAKRIGALLIHFSTDYVFDGAKKQPYVESDPANPLSVYGGSKLAGELALGLRGIPYFIFRTSWVYGATGKNFLLSILRLARDREHLKIVGDQHGAPTWSFDLARMTANILTRFENAAMQANCSLLEITLPVSGIYHATSSGETTWHGFAVQAMSELQRLAPATKLAVVEDILTADYPTAAMRPLNSLLDCSKLEQVLHWRLPDWRHSLSLVVSELVR